MKSLGVKSLSVIAVILLIATALATSRAFHYRSLYLHNPQVKTKTVERKSVIRQTQFDPNRSQAYTCTPQKVSPGGVGMVCVSPDAPDRNVRVECTTTGGAPVEYFC